MKLPAPYTANASPYQKWAGAGVEAAKGATGRRTAHAIDAATNARRSVVMSPTNCIRARSFVRSVRLPGPERWQRLDPLSETKGPQHHRLQTVRFDNEVESNPCLDSKMSRQRPRGEAFEREAPEGAADARASIERRVVEYPE